MRSHQKTVQRKINLTNSRFYFQSQLLRNELRNHLAAVLVSAEKVAVDSSDATDAGTDTPETTGGRCLYRWKACEQESQ